MNGKGTSKFVKGLLFEWLKIIEDNDTLDQIIEQVEARRKSLRKEQKIERFANLIDQYRQLQKRHAHGTVLYLIKPLPRKDAGPLPMQNSKPKVSQRNEMKRYNERMQVKFWQWQPKKKTLWVTVPWKTGIEKYGENFIPMTIRDIKAYQPSRTETDIRLRELVRQGNAK